MKRAVILIADDYQDLEVWYPLLRLREAGWQVVTAGVDSKKNYRGKNGYPLVCDTTVEEIKADDFDCVVIPGGWAPDYIRRNRVAVELVKQLDSQKKVVAAICHAGWVLTSADIVRNRRCTSFSAIKDDLIHAGGKWVDEEVVVDDNLITSRKPDDLPAFCREILRVGKAG